MPTVKETREQMVSEGVITIDEAMQMTSFSRAGLYKLMDRGDLQYVKVGFARRIPRRAVIALLERGLVAR